MAYSSTEDLLLGNLPTPQMLSRQKYVEQAADEIDAALGFIYETPFDVSDASAMVRPARLLIKQISNNIASGRLLLAVAAPTEGNETHAYGRSLIWQATQVLAQITKGDVFLEGATLIDPGPTTQSPVVVGNVDSRSQVEAFYDEIANPNFGLSLTRLGAHRDAPYRGYAG